MPGFFDPILLILIRAITELVVGHDPEFSVVGRKLERIRSVIHCAAARQIRMQCAPLLSLLPTKVPTVL
jgi:hypothetical protein